MTFAEVHPYLATICLGYSRRYPALEVDELVDEMWLRCDFSKFTAFRGQGLSRHIECRLVDYLRVRFGRPGQKGHALRCRTVNLETAGGVGRRVAARNGLDAIDSGAEFDCLISGLKPRTRSILDMYYRQGLTQEKIGKSLGLSESRISQQRIAALEHLRRRLSA